VRGKVCKVAILAVIIVMADLLVPGVAADEILLQTVIFTIFAGAIFLKN
jgi:hypothetical protein